MTSEEAGTVIHRSPRIIRSSFAAAASDDEISVIAVIKKGTSGIPKRARYHYIRELPLASVKSLKKSLQKAKDQRTQARIQLPDIETCAKSKGPIQARNDGKKPRVIELGDETSKMELREQFKITEKFSDDDEELVRTDGRSVAPTAGENNVMHKLPPGTVLIKQEPRTPSVQISSNRNRAGNGSSTGTTTTTNMSNSTSSASSSASSCGSGSSSGGFGSGPASPLAKVKRLHRGAKTASRKKTVDVVPRRNPKRCGSKKSATSGEVAPTSRTTGMTTRPRQRQRLLTTRMQESEVLTNRRTRPATMPYMNTRSVTRKLYTVGATYQAPTRKDETEWREWPVHGMHERPVFHPQIGLAAGYAGRIFWTTTNEDGSNWTYREVLDASEEVEVVPVDPRPKGTATSPTGSPTGESFEVCMHESLHSVLAYCAQVMAPDYRRTVGKERRHEVQAGSEPGGQLMEKEVEVEAEVGKFESETSQLNLTELEDSSISDETLMEMSSIYKKLLPVEEQPWSQENSPLRSAGGSPAAGNEFSAVKIGEDRSSVSKNSNQASEIARILSEYNASVKEKGFGRTSGSPNSIAAAVGDNFAKDLRKKLDSEKSVVRVKALKIKKTLDLDENLAGLTAANNVETMESADKSINSPDNWLENLLVDTSLLYCVATGVGQRDLTQYVDSLDAKQSLQWLRNRQG